MISSATVSRALMYRSIALVIMAATCTNVLAELPPVPVPPENPITEQKRILGKILFWEEQLSSDNTVACGTCHIPASGGADPRAGAHPGPDGLFQTADDTVGSPGVVSMDENGELIASELFAFYPQVTGRAAPGIFVSMYSEDNFWDGRAGSQFIDPQDGQTVIIQSGGSLESQAVGPILSGVEMARQNRTWSDVITKLLDSPPLRFASEVPVDMEDAIAENPSYAALFESAFGDAEITAARIGMAIATYERTLVPDQSPWDLYEAGDESAMSASQIAGWESFRDDTVCDNCHRPPEFTDHQFYNIGLRPSEDDQGRMAVSDEPNDTGSFKTPSLRNSGLKTALMHVGWVTDVRDAIDFYNATADAENGIQNRHVQFSADQDPVPTVNAGPGPEYDTLSMFSRSEVRKNEVADFIANALTDPRVAAEQFPFDRPTLRSERLSTALRSGAMTGSWYDPSHTGEGWAIEVLADGRAVVTWYTYDLQGAQMWLIGVGEITGNSIHIDEMLVTQGAVFGLDFDPDDVILSNWGILDIEFDECDSAEVSYQSNGEFGSGTLQAIRLTALAGLECMQ